MIITCRECGETVERPSGRSKYCPECAIIVQRRQWREYWRREKGNRRRESRTFICAGCGKTLRAKGPRGPVPRWCDDCNPRFQHKQGAVDLGPAVVDGKAPRRPGNYFNQGDLQHLPAEKLAAAVNQVTAGKAMFTMTLERNGGAGQ